MDGSSGPYRPPLASVGPRRESDRSHLQVIWPALVLACGVGLVWGASLSLVTLAGGSYTEVLIEALICVAPTFPVAGGGLVQPWRRRGFGVVVRSGYLCMLLVAVWVAWGCAARLLH